MSSGIGPRDGWEQERLGVSSTPPPPFPCLHGPQGKWTIVWYERGVFCQSWQRWLAVCTKYSEARRGRPASNGKGEPCQETKTTYLLSDLPNCPRPQESQRNLWGCRAGGRHRDLRQKIMGPRYRHVQSTSHVSLTLDWLRQYTTILFETPDRPSAPTALSVAWNAVFVRESYCTSSGIITPQCHLCFFSWSLGSEFRVSRPPGVQLLPATYSGSRMFGCKTSSTAPGLFPQLLETLSRSRTGAGGDAKDPTRGASKA